MKERQVVPNYVRALREDAHPRALLVAVAHSTRDLNWLDTPLRDVENIDDESPEEWASTPAGRALVQVAASLFDHAAEDTRDNSWISPTVLKRMLSALTGQSPSDDYHAKVADDLGLSWSISMERQREGDVTRTLEWERFVERLGPVVIVGAGIFGLAAGAELANLGVPFRILERGPDLGGVWRSNHYPGCGVDNHFEVYSFREDERYRWSRHCPKRDEIMEYLHAFAERHELAHLIEYGVEVTRITYRRTDRRWVLDAVTADGGRRQWEAGLVITAMGPLSRPRVPQLPGHEEFLGRSFHTAEWPDDFDARGRRIAVVGNGSSGVQVLRALAADAEDVVVFSRSPHWIAPNPRAAREVTPGERLLVERLPQYSTWWRQLLNWYDGDGQFERIVIDPDWNGPGISAENERVRRDLERYIRRELDGNEELAQKLTPRYPPFLRRMVMDNEWYRSLLRDNVRLVSERVTKLDRTAIVGESGNSYEVDTIVWATGFHGTKFFWPTEIVGREARTPSEVFGGDDEIRAYMGMCMPEFPNLFSLSGPNSIVGHGGSAVWIAEMQASFVAEMLRHLCRTGGRTFECTWDALHQYNAALDDDLSKRVWTVGSTNSRFRNHRGRVTSTHPWPLAKYWRMTREVDSGAFRISDEEAAGANETYGVRRA